MKFAIYKLVAVVLAGLGVSFGFTSSQPKPVKNHEPVREMVYVDVDELVRFHPSYDALSEMGALKGAGDDTGAGLARDFGGVSELTEPSFEADVESARQNRERLHSKTMNEAAAALEQLEETRLKALQIRLRVSRETMMQNADERVRAKAREIEQTASKKISAVADNYSEDRINAQLKVSALKTARIANDVDAEDVAEKLRRAEADLDRINALCASEQEEIIAEAESNIEALQSEAGAKVAAALSIAEKDHSRRIAADSIDAQEQIDKMMLESAVDAKVDSGGYVAKTNVGHTLRIHGEKSSGADLGGLKSVEDRLRADVKRVLMEVAADKGYEISFVRRSGVRDASVEFAQIMKSYAWRECEPILVSDLDF